MGILQPINLLARRLLYVWVQTTVLPDEPSSIGVDASAPVCYVLDTRAWSNLLVLEQECLRTGLPAPTSPLSDTRLANLRSVYSLTARAPFLFWRSADSTASPTLHKLTELVRQHGDLDVQLVPVSIFWGRAPARQKSWLKVLLADTWGLAGRTRKLLTILAHGRHTLVHFAAPVSLRSLLQQQIDEAHQVAHVQQSLRDVLDAQRTATLGPDMSHRRTLVRDLMSNPDVRSAINEARVADQSTLDAAERRARRYLMEISAAATGITIQLVYRSLTWFWNRFYGGVDVANLEQIQTLAREHSLVYVPCHRSHIDYLLLSYVIYTNGLALPSIAAGVNLNLPVIGGILRRGGAFFIRRSFRDNRLYAAVLFEYLSSLVTQGAPVEYFIEGGRSRTGRMLSPRAGMLAMTLRAALRAPGRTLQFVPVYIGYEKLIEGDAYLGELQGRKKQRETLFGALLSVARLRGRFGKVYVNFGEPLDANAMLEKHRAIADSSGREETPPWLRSAVTELGDEVCRRINAAAVVNPINLVSLSLLAMPRQCLGEHQLQTQVSLYQSLLADHVYSEYVQTTTMDAAAIVSYCERLGVLRRRQHALGDLLYFEQEDALRMTYYRNNVLHLLALPSLIACCFTGARRFSTERIVQLITLAYRFVAPELFLPWREEQLPAIVERTLAQFSRRELLHQHDDGRWKRPETQLGTWQQLSLLARVIQPLIERCYMIVAVLQSAPMHGVDRKALEEQCYLQAQRLSILYELDLPDFYDRALLHHFVELLLEMNYARTDSDDRLTLTSDIRELESVRLLLSQQVRQTIAELINEACP